MACKCTKSGENPHDDLLRFGEPEEDRADNLCTTFNVVQENAIKGGVRGVSINAETGRRRRASSRAVTGIDQDVKLNKALWVLGQRMAELKA